MYIYVLYGYIYPHCNIHRFSIPGQNTIFSWLAWPQWFKDLHLLSPHGHRMLRADVEDVFRQAWCLEILENRGRNIGEIMMMRTVIMFYYCYYPLVNVDIAMERSTIFNGKTHYFNGHFQ